jgi:hypothetical protein
MSLILRRRLENAIVGYLQANAATIGVSSSNIVSAHAQAERPNPCLVVAAMQMQAEEDLERVAEVQLVVQYHSGGTVGGSERATTDTVIEKVNTFLLKPPDDGATWSDSNPEAGALRVALNKPASGTDSRTVQPLHIYDFYASEDNGDILSEGWVDELVYTVKAQPMNSH